MTATVNRKGLKVPHFDQGVVTLVGAGPGDPELLTIKAVKAINQATVLLVDDLVNDEILFHASSEASIIHVGKRGGCQSTPQALIEKLMIREARKGETVVRLKGGDPFIFGRGGEEIEHLRDAGITVKVINGITSGLAAAGALDISLTHRNLAQGVLFITGHNKPGSTCSDWTNIAQSAFHNKLTLVIYMGVASAESIMNGLLKGLSGETPAAIVQSASLPNQRQVGCTLGTLTKTLDENNFGSPAIMIVGDVVAGYLSMYQSASIFSDDRLVNCA